MKNKYNQEKKLGPSKQQKEKWAKEQKKKLAEKVKALEKRKRY